MQLSVIFLLIQYVFYTECLYGPNVRLAHEGEFPFIVSINAINDTNPEKEKDYICTGTLISRRDVLTIAHNIEHHDMNNFEVIYGSVDLRAGRRVRIQWLITYNNWLTQRNMPDNMEIDLSILRLANVTHINPAIMSPVPKADLYGLHTITAGWGNSNDGLTPRFMEALNLKVMKPRECKHRILGLTKRKSTKVHKRYICSSGRPVGFLREGDSGGPLLYFGQLIAVNKGSCPLPDEDLNPQRVNIHTGIDDYRYFIVDVISNF